MSKYIGFEMTEEKFPMDLLETMLKAGGAVFIIENPEKTFGITGLNHEKEPKKTRRGRKKKAPENPDSGASHPSESPISPTDNPVSA
jgi:hypothetical protein